MTKDEKKAHKRASLIFLVLCCLIGGSIILHHYNEKLLELIFRIVVSVILAGLLYAVLWVLCYDKR